MVRYKNYTKKVTKILECPMLILLHKLYWPYGIYKWIPGFPNQPIVNNIPWLLGYNQRNTMICIPLYATTILLHMYLAFRNRGYKPSPHTLPLDSRSYVGWEWRNHNYNLSFKCINIKVILGWAGGTKKWLLHRCMVQWISVGGIILPVPGEEWSLSIYIYLYWHL